jgi:hypothetical protein
VARFYNNRLYELEICGLYAPGKSTTLLRFLESRYKSKNEGKRIQEFFAQRGAPGLEGALSFADTARKRTLFLTRQGNLSNVLYRDNGEQAQKMKEEKQKESAMSREMEQERKARVSKGFKAGDCVRWRCDIDCNYEGRVKKVDAKSQKVTVTITRSLENPYEEGRNVPIGAEELYDCD